MKTLALIVFAVLCSQAGQAHAEPPVPGLMAPVPGEEQALVEYFRKTPVSLNGRIQFEEPVRLFHEDMAGFDVLEGSLRPHTDLYISLSRTHLEITSAGGLILYIGGLPVSVLSLNYDNVTGAVDIKSKVLGFRGSSYVESWMAAKLQKKFCPKLKLAFAKIVQVRQQNSLTDAGVIVDEVINVFKEHKPGSKPAPPLPTFGGELTLTTPIATPQVFQIGPLVAALEEGDTLSSTALIRVPRHSRLQIRGLLFGSSKGIHLRTPGATPGSLKTAILNGFSATEGEGLKIEATNGVDDAINGLAVLVAIAKAGSRHSSRDANADTVLKDFSPTKLIQQLVEAKARGGLREYVVTNRPRLLAAGATVELLKALESAE